jgi:hypothetical protein
MRDAYSCTHFIITASSDSEPIICKILYWLPEEEQRSDMNSALKEDGSSMWISEIRHTTYKNTFKTMVRFCIKFEGIPKVKTPNFVRQIRIKVHLKML